MLVNNMANEEILQRPGKRLALFFDGTWNKPENNTNVWRLYLMLGRQSGDGVLQESYYDEGLGARWYDELTGGIFGRGLSVNVREGYRWLMEHYDHGDEIYLFGFSRGAFTARSLAGLIARCGLLKPDSPVSFEQIFERYQKGDVVRPIYELKYLEENGEKNFVFEEQVLLKHVWYHRDLIKMVGVWDTVGSIGVPFGNIKGISRNTLHFHNTHLSTIVQHSYQALALDEERQPYWAVLWTRFIPEQPDPQAFLDNHPRYVEQRWFSGAHANVGGGYRRISRSLHNAACLFRFCVRKCLLPNNPLAHVDNSSFANYATRDFLPPDQLEILLDIQGLKGGAPVDLNNELSVRDRLTALLLVDLALRRSELASLSWDNVQHNREGDGCLIQLAPENQKMATKAAIALPILYPPTQKLLERYAQMRDIKIGQHNNTPLIIDKKQLPASSKTIACIIKQLATKLGLRTYHQAVPSCHDLRRTFATCNAKPLGLELDLQEISERLRAGINVINQHYILQNPLLQESKAKKHREKLKSKDTDEVIMELLQTIETMAPKDIGFLESYKTVVTNRQTSRREAHAIGHVAEWIPEIEAISILRKVWNHVPRVRCLRQYFTSRHALKRIGKHGLAYYDAVIVSNLADKYEPISDHVGVLSKEMRQIVLLFEPMAIGHVKLIKRNKIGEFFKAIKNGDEKLTNAKTDKT